MGNIFTEIKIPKGDILFNTYDYLIAKARGSMFATKRKLRKIVNLPPRIDTYVFQAVAEPILLYGCDVWGTSNKGTSSIDKLCLWYLRSVLKVKSSTSNTIVWGELGYIPPSIKCHHRLFCYYMRLKTLPDSMLVKKAFNDMLRLHEQGFTTWVTKVHAHALVYGLDLEAQNVSTFKIMCKNHLYTHFINTWQSKLSDTTNNPILRTYRLFKSKFQFEPYLNTIKNYQHRQGLTRLRSNSHDLEIERGRHHNIPVSDRLCDSCNVIEDEFHFMLNCVKNERERDDLFSKINRVFPNYDTLDNISKFVYLFKSDDPQIVTWLSKYIADSLKVRRHANTKVRTVMTA